MKKSLLFAALLGLSSLITAQTASFFNSVPESAVSRSSAQERIIVPNNYKTVQLDLDGFSQSVQAAQSRLNSRSATITAQFPKLDGGLESYTIYDSEVMHPDLQAKYPNIRSYFGISQENPLNKVYFTITSQGFRGLIRGEKTIYIDPYSKGDMSNYIIYERNQLKRDATDDWRCYADDLAENTIEKSSSDISNRNFQDGILRRYEIAIACTSEYTAYHNDGNNANGDARADALAAMVVTVARVNTVYEQDLAMTFQIVPRNDELIYFNGVSVGPNANGDPYDNYDGGQMLGVNTGNITGRIGSGSYDIGHVFSTGGGGIAGTSPCDDGGGKGRGVTGIVTPEFDPFDIDYVSHEIGHQFSAGHTYYNACFGSKVAEDYETGSASTIMGYAGICVPNVQENSDAYFHASSIERITNSVLGNGGLPQDTCDEEINIANDAPTAIAGSNYTIPISTPFILDATGTTDPNGDILTYCWEQYDNDGTFPQPPQATNAGGPVFRTLFPTTDPARTFPNLEAVINNETPTWEVLPSVARSMNFRLTVRDNNPLGGQTDQSNSVITVSGTRGPFLVSYPNAASITWYAGNTETVTWDVNNTAALSANVNILLSTDGGYTYPVTLASGVPNDGSQDITVPNNIGSSNRIKIEAASNIFFDLSNQDFEIKAGTWEFATGAPIQNVCQGDDATYFINFTPAPGYTDNVTFSASGNPSGTAVNFSPASTNTAGLITMTVSNTTGIPIGSYPITVTGTSNPSSDVETISTTFNVYDNTIGNVVQSSPANGAINQPAEAIFQWNALATAASYTVQIASTPDFNTVVEAATVFNVNTYQASSLSPGETYYWRVRPANPCVIGNFNTVFSFQTADQVCNTYTNEYFENNDFTWETNSTNAVSARMDVPDNIIINDVSFYMRADHTNINHIKMQFSSPEGRFAEIYNRDCSGQDFDVTFSDAGSILTCGNVDGSTNASLEGVQQAGQLFTRFHGENAQGTWVLLATDRTAGSGGGTFNEFSVTVCGELQATTTIVIEENNVLNVTTGQTLLITNSVLEASQSGASTAQLSFVLDGIPGDGTLNLSGTPLNVGETFTQQDIDAGNLSYTNNGTAGGNDNFTFTVNGINSESLSGQIFNIIAPQVSAPPVAMCQDITVDLGASGTVTILPAQIDNGSNDDVGVVNYSIDKDTFDCDDLGTPQMVTLTVTDDEGQAASCTAIVTLTHDTPPANVVVSAVTGSSATVSWDDAGADSYEVRFRESGMTTWTTQTGIAGTSTTLNSLTSETQYDAEVRAECNGDFTSFSVTVNFTTLETVLNYCPSFGTRTSFEWIENVTLEDIDNTSGANGGYANFRTNLNQGFTTDLIIGTTPLFSLNKEFDNGTGYNESVSVWIDFNKNGDFSDSGEQVIREGANTADLVNEPFLNAIPNGASTGTTTMRVAMKYFGTAGTFNNDPCSQFQDGEVEDYTVTIVNPDPCPNTTVYAGNWDNGLPAADKKVIINSNYTINATDLEACTLEIGNGAILTIVGSHFARVQGNITVNGTLIVEHEGSLVQVDDAATVTKNAGGVIEVHKTSLDMKPRDFMLMSSPMTAETRDGVFGNVIDAATSTLDQAFRVIYLNPENFMADPAVTGYAPYMGAETFLSIDNSFLGNHTASEAIVPAEGYVIYPQESFLANGTTTTYDFNFNKGTLNNGIVNYPIQYNGATIDNFNLIGNPYASAIDIEQLIAANPMINEVYFWEHVTTPNGSLPGYLGENPSMQDFSMRNLTTGMAAINKPGSTPSQYIASGQGFAIKADQAFSGTDPVVTFSNAIRVTANNDQFRQSSVEKELLWLKISNETYDLQSKTAIGFLPEATNRLDRGYDSKRLATPLSIYSALEDGTQLGIQGLGNFDPTMVIPVGFATAIEESSTYSISLDNITGEALERTEIYLVDLLTNDYTNLKERPFVFESGMLNDGQRFVLAFEKDETLGINDEANLSSLISLYPNPTKATITLSYTGGGSLAQAIISDVQGKIIDQIDLSDFNSTKTFDISRYASGTYFVQIQSSNEMIVKRIIKQ